MHRALADLVAVADPLEDVVAEAAAKAHLAVLGQADLGQAAAAADPISGN